MNVLALCPGIGGLELGLRTAVPSARTVCYVERDHHAVAVIQARIEDGQLDDAPIWDDVRTFDGRPWRGLVDCVTAGYPCQGESRAGKRAGADDERWLWPDIWRIVRETGAHWLAIENVAGHLSGSWHTVTADLAASGWRVEWDCVPAAAAGAPHLRDRVFALAASSMAHVPSSDANSCKLWQQSVAERWVHGSLQPAISGKERAVANSDRIGRAQVERGSEPPGRRQPDSGCRRLWMPEWNCTQAPEPCLYRVDDGVQGRMDGNDT